MQVKNTASSRNTHVLSLTAGEAGLQQNRISQLVSGSEGSKEFDGLRKLITPELRRVSEYRPNVGALSTRKLDEQGLGDNCEKYRAELLDGISSFEKSLNRIQSEINANNNFNASYKDKRIQYVTRLAQYVNAVREKAELANIDDRAIKLEGGIAHNLALIVSETLSHLVTKLSRHPDDAVHRAIAKKIIDTLYDAFPTYFRVPCNPFRQLLPERLGVNDANEIVKKIVRHINAQQEILRAGVHKISPQTVGDVYIAAAQLCVKSVKPQSRPYNPSGTRCDFHSHQNNNYDPKYDGGVTGIAWADNMARSLDIKWHFVMPIPHRIITSGEDQALQPAGMYYMDYFVKTCCHANKDAKARENIKAVKKLIPGYGGISTATGVKIAPDAMTPTWDDLISDAQNFARKYAEHCAMEQIKGSADAYNIGVVFGELVVNKKNFPQALIASFEENTEKSFSDMTSKLLTAIYKGAHEGVESAVKKKMENNDSETKKSFTAQVRVVLHIDTDEIKSGTPVSRQVTPADTDVDGGLIRQNKPEPSISKDVTDLVQAVNASLEAETHALIATTPIDFKNVLQLAHLVGVTPKNYSAKNNNRTNALYDLFAKSRTFSGLGVVADTSWLTAAARYANRGMGNFFKAASDNQLRALGEHMITADNIANNGFMFFDEGERYFQNRMAAGDHSTETIYRAALMRASLRKTFLSYYNQIGEICDLFEDKTQGASLGSRLMNYIKSDAMKTSLHEGNFIGLLYKLYKDQKSRQGQSPQNNLHDAVPFVWGSDGLTQSESRSGAEKFKLYRDQLVVESVMEMMIDSLRLDAPTEESKRDAEDLNEILKSLRMGSENDQKSFSPAQPTMAKKFGSLTLEKQNGASQKNVEDHGAILEGGHAEKGQHFLAPRSPKYT